jgi:large subunit ribosomal protein L21
MAYAIVKTGGKQYRVEEGQKLLVERLRVDEGATVDLEPCSSARPTPSSTRRASARSRSRRACRHERGPKIRVFKFKPKRGYKRTTGHRQELTRLEVDDEVSNGS